MKIFCAVLITIVSAAIVKGIDPEEKKKMMMAIVGSCKDSTGASDDDIATLMMDAIPQTKEGKCMLNCFLESMGLIKDGRLSKDGVMAWAKSLNVPGDITDKLLAECEGVSDPDVCESGTKVEICVKSAAAKYNINADF